MQKNNSNWLVVALGFLLISTSILAQDSSDFIPFEFSAGEEICRTSLAAMTGKPLNPADFEKYFNSYGKLISALSTKLFSILELRIDPSQALRVEFVSERFSDHIHSDASLKPVLDFVRSGKGYVAATQIKIFEFRVSIASSRTRTMFGPGSMYFVIYDPLNHYIQVVEGGGYPIVQY